MLKYEELPGINSTDKSKLGSVFSGIIDILKHVSSKKILSILYTIPDICKMHHQSIENRKTKQADIEKHYHPIRPLRGEIYDARITEGVGSELAGNHPVVIIQNDKGNIYGEKVNVLPIEGDGNKINPNYQIPLSNLELEFGALSKNPSRIIVTDIMTIDKSRLGIKIGRVRSDYMGTISKALKKQLEI